MLVILIVILILIWVAVVWSIYSNFMVFHSNFSETENYHRAYYSSISALERAELVTKQRQPGYEWSGGFILWTGYWGNPITNDWWSDKSLSGFSYYWNNEDDTSVFRTIKSKTSRIPATWNWDVEWMLSYNNPSNPEDNSSNYNMMNYENAEVFLLYNDKSSGNPYKYTSTRKDGGLNFDDVGAWLKKEWMIKWEIRLPVLLNSGFWFLDTGNALVWQNGILPTNDAIVDWQIRGYSLDNFGNVCWWKYCIPFTIYSTQSVAFWGSEVKIIETWDSVFREDDINNTLKFWFWNSGRSPFNSNRWIDSITIIGEWKSDVTSSSSVNNLWSVLKDNTYLPFRSTNMRFSLLNLLQWKGNNIYPFLEYYIDFWENEVPDKYFTIDAEWTYKDYKVNTIIKKPTSKESIFWNFTSIF